MLLPSYALQIFNRKTLNLSLKDLTCSFITHSFSSEIQRCNIRKTPAYSEFWNRGGCLRSLILLSDFYVTNFLQALFFTIPIILL